MTADHARGDAHGTSGTGDAFPRKITFVITSLGLGGAQAQVRHLTRVLHERGWDVHVVTLVDAAANDGIPPNLTPGVATSTLGMRRGLPDPRALAQLVRHLRERRPTVVHSHMVHANLLARAARAFARVPVLISTACNEYEGGRWADLAYRATDRLTDLTTNKSPRAVKRFVDGGAAPRDRIRFVPNGIDVSSYLARSDDGERARVLRGLGVPEGHFVWLSAGRLEDAKDFPNLLAAVRTVRSNHPDVHVLVAGDGPLSEDLQARAREEGVAAHVTFLGYRDDVQALMAVADGYVMSSAWEGLPMTLLEAGASRLPLVATDVGGNSEVVLDGRNGHLVPARDSDALAAAMARVVTLPEEERRALGDRAYEHVEETFDLERVVDRWEEIYRSAYRGA